MCVCVCMYVCTPLTFPHSSLLQIMYTRLFQINLPPRTYHLPPRAYHLPHRAYHLLPRAYHPPPLAYLLPPRAYHLPHRWWKQVVCIINCLIDEKRERHTHAKKEKKHRETTSCCGGDERKKDQKREGSRSNMQTKQIMISSMLFAKA